MHYVVGCSRVADSCLHGGTDRGNWESRYSTHTPVWMNFCCFDLVIIYAVCLELMPRSMSLIPSRSLYIFIVIGVCFQKSASHPLHQKTQAVSAILKIEQVSRQEVEKLLSSAAASHVYANCCLFIWQAWLGHVWSLSWIQGVLKTTCSPILKEKRERDGAILLTIVSSSSFHAWGLSTKTTTLASSSSSSLLL